MSQARGDSSIYRGKGNENLKVLFACMGNICRSPTAEGVFRHMLAESAPHLEVHVESAGTHAYHVGEPPGDGAE